jgi:type IV pilus assembly protein PilW
MSGLNMGMRNVRRLHRDLSIAHPAVAGFGLIELMIGILIGTVLLLGLTQVFSTTRNAYQTSEGLARTQESSRFAMDFLQRDLRMAGHQGCVNDVAHFSSTTPQLFSHFLTGTDRAAKNWAAAPYGQQFNLAIQGYEYTGSAPGNTVNISGNTDPVPFGAAGAWTPSLPNELVAANGSATPGVVVGSDVVVVRTFDTNSIPVTAVNTAVTPATFTVPVSYAGQVIAGNLYGLADCVKASVFQATTSANATTGQFTVGVSGANLSGFLSGENYVARQLQLYPLRSVAYYIGRGTNGGPALMRLNFSNGCTTNCVPEELVDGIENLQFMYGYDNHGSSPDGGVDVYWTAQQVTNLGAAQVGSVDNAWRRIGTVRFGFIARSIDQAQADNAVTVAAGAPVVVGTNVTIPPNDLRLRNVYTTTVALRNQLFGN